ncbi:MAG: S-layer family protein, partial [Burkholderiales bacterium]
PAHRRWRWSRRCRSARQQLDLGAQSLNNEDGALIYSGGSIAIGGALDNQRLARGQAADVKNLSATIEADGHLILSAKNLVNERRNVAIEQVTVSLAATDSVFFASFGSHYGYRGNRSRYAIASTGEQTLYFTARVDGVSNPDQVAGAADVHAAHTSTVTMWESNTLTYSAAYGRCTTNCVVLMAPLDYTNPDAIIFGLRGHPSQTAGNEVARTAHQTVLEDRLNPDAGAAAAIRAGGAMQLDIQSSLVNRHGDIQSGGNFTVNASGASVVNEGTTLKRTYKFDNTTHTASYGDYSWKNPDINEVIGRLGGSMGSNAALTINAQDLANTDLQRITAAPTAGLNFLGISLAQNTPAITVSQSALFQAAAPSRQYLIESDSRFTNYRQWLGSDYMLTALSYDPAAVQKRLGDSFYEQKLIRDQVAQLTGRRFLDDHANDEAQYRALMN